MFRTLQRRKAQTVAEYAILIGLVIAAITGVQFFIKSGIQKQIKYGVDHLAADGLQPASNPVDLTGMTSETLTNQDIDDTENLRTRGVVDRTSVGNVQSTRNETIIW